MSIACSATHCQSAQLLSHTQSLSMYTSSACSFSRRPRTPASAAAPLAALPDLRLGWSDGVSQTVLVRRCWSASWGYRQASSTMTGWGARWMHCIPIWTPSGATTEHPFSPKQKRRANARRSW